MREMSKEALSNEAREGNMKRITHIATLSLIASFFLQLPANSSTKEHTPGQTDEDLLQRIQSLEQRYRRAHDELDVLHQQLVEHYSHARVHGDERPASRIRYVGANVLTFPIDVLSDGTIHLMEVATETFERIQHLVRRLADGGKGKELVRRGEASQRRPSMQSTFDATSIGHWHGITMIDLAPSLGRIVGAQSGVLLARNTLEHSPLMGGDIILRIGEHVPADASHAVELLQGYADDELVPLLLWRGGRTLVVEVDFPAPN